MPNIDNKNLGEFKNFTLSFLSQLQGGSSGRGIQFVDMKLKVLLQCKRLILKRNCYCNVNKMLSLTSLTTLYSVGQKGMSFMSQYS